MKLMGRRGIPFSAQDTGSCTSTLARRKLIGVTNELQLPTPRTISVRAESGGRWQGRAESRQHQHRPRCRHLGVFPGDAHAAQFARARVAPNVASSNYSAGLQQSQRGAEGSSCRQWL
ncbi:hypothetical protein Nmel_006921 [Mimus melanotis]